jgi:protein-S-isoprenylcysteine O-methyltransferase Ste14
LGPLRLISYVGRLREACARKGNGPLAITVVFAVLVVCAVCLAAVAGLELVQRLVPSEKRQEHNDVAGFLYAVLGVVYAVLLALVVIAVWQQYQRARETAESEANAVAEIALLAHRLPEPEHHQLQEDARSYAREVVDQEWPLMAQRAEQERGTPEGWDLVDDMRANLQEVEPGTEAQQALYAQGLNQLQRLGDARRMRLVQANETMPGILWAVLVFGGVVTVGFTYLFGLQNTWAHRLMVVSLTAVIALIIFTIWVMEHPFSGGARLEPSAFELVLERFETSKLSDL